MGCRNWLGFLTPVCVRKWLVLSLSLIVLGPADVDAQTIEADELVNNQLWFDYFDTSIEGRSWCPNHPRSGSGRALQVGRNATVLGRLQLIFNYKLAFDSIVLKLMSQE